MTPVSSRMASSIILLVVLCASASIQCDLTEKRIHEGDVEIPSVLPKDLSTNENIKHCKPTNKNGDIKKENIKLRGSKKTSIQETGTRDDVIIEISGK